MKKPLPCVSPLTVSTWVQGPAPESAAADRRPSRVLSPSRSMSCVDSTRRMSLPAPARIEVIARVVCTNCWTCSWRACGRATLPSSRSPSPPTVKSSAFVPRRTVAASIPSYSTRPASADAAVMSL